MSFVRRVQIELAMATNMNQIEFMRPLIYNVNICKSYNIESNRNESVR